MTSKKIHPALDGGGTDHLLFEQVRNRPIQFGHVSIRDVQIARSHGSFIAPVTPTLGMIAIALEVALRDVGCTHNVEQRGGVVHADRFSRVAHRRLNCPVSNPEVRKVTVRILSLIQLTSEKQRSPD